MENKRLIGYFAVTLLVLAVCVQVVTAPAAPTNAQLQTEISNQQSQINLLISTNQALTASDNNLNTKLTSLQNIVSAIKPGSQVVVQTGMVTNGDTIPVPTGYTTDQCKVILGIGIAGKTDEVDTVKVDSNQVLSNSWLQTEVWPNSTKNGFNVDSQLCNEFVPFNTDSASNQVSYMLIATK
jgi:uncharacterized protein GlcG (DUF336 family)